MVVLGIDVHKGTHTAVAVDEVGRKLGEKTVRATDAGHRQLLRWVLRQWCEAAVTFAVEDCRHVSTRLERALLAAGQPVVRVPPKLMAGARSSARTWGKSDPIDALAIARAALREPNLPIATHDRVSREIKLLVDHREDLVNTRTQQQNRLRWHLHELDPELDRPLGGWTGWVSWTGLPTGCVRSRRRWWRVWPPSSWPTSATSPSERTRCNGNWPPGWRSWRPGCSPCPAVVC